MAEELQENIEREVNSIKDSIRTLQDDLKDMLQAISSQGKDKIMETKERIQSALRDIKGHTGRHFHRMYDTCCEHSHNAAEKSRERITERPLTSVLISFAAGLLLGKLVMRR